MKLSQGFWQTYKEVPKDAEIASHQLMLRAGLMHKSGAGLYNFLPVGLKVVQKIEKVVREELNKAGCFETLMTVVTPGELWEESGRWEKMSEMAKFEDKAGRNVCLSPTNEEAITDIFRKTISSYKNLPVTLYQINTKFRDEIRPRFGVMRAREFIMKDAYSFHTDFECLDKTYQVLYEAYSNIFKRMGLEFIVVEADGGAMTGGKAKTHEFQVVADSGEDAVLVCQKCQYSANVEAAVSRRASLDFNDSTSTEEVETPGKKTIEEVCDFLKLPQHQSIKSLIYKIKLADDEKFVAAFVLGDDSLNEIKLQQQTKCLELRPASDSEMAGLGFIKGFIGPNSAISANLDVFVDSAVDLSKGYVVGADKADYHLKNYQFDSSKITSADLRNAKAGDVCASCEGTLTEKRGIEVGHIFQLGDKYSKSMDASILNKEGKRIFPVMGCYGIGITRTMAAVIEQFHDDKGIIWPTEIAPYQVHFCFIGKSDDMKEQAEKIYQELLSAGHEVIFDDRNAGAGFKFKDADLLGCPVRLVLGERDFKKDGKLEIKARNQEDVQKISPEEILNSVQSLLDSYHG